jgi:acyl transferase domain-containing protein
MVNSTTPSAATAIRQEPVAIIGMGCRFPGADGPHAFWDLLVRGGDAITEVPAERWDARRYYDPRPATAGRTNSRWGGFVAGIDQFDPAFFGISAREAAEMDPQQRLALEVAWEAIEDSGYGPDLLAGSATGVFLGVSSADYSLLRFRHASTLNAYSCTGNAHSVAANRISYVLDLRGPSIAVDTACSSSLVATHLAAQSLRTGESDLAIAGGVSALLSADVYVAFSQSRYLAPDGHCKTFDAGANGYGRGEGCGMVMLKRLADAVADGDRILAVIRGSAINQDGRSNGLNAPNPDAQRDVIRKALRSAGVAPADISYVETHGTGTELGDPIEVSSLAAVLSEGRTPGERCLLGAVKTNIGHLEAAAGVAGLIKTVLAVMHGIIPSVAHLERPNAKLDLEATPFDIPVRAQPWPEAPSERIAGVSAFGFGGTNAHAIVTAPPPRTVHTAGADRPRHIVTLSARTAGLLRVLAARYADHLAGCADPLPDIAFTANTGRAHFAWRLAAQAASAEELAAGLRAFSEEAGEPAAAEMLTAGRAPARAPRVGFLCSGHGSQHPGSGRDLYRCAPAFRAAVDHCDAFVRDRLGSSPRAFIEGDATGGGFAADLTAQFTLEYALAELLTSWGIRPRAVLGHSLGEYVAACVAGALGVDEALTLVTERGRLMASLPAPGAMAAAFDSETAVRKILQDCQGVAIAAVNGPVSTVISGYRDSVTAAVRQLAGAGIEARLLRIPVAAHSPLLDPILDDFERAAQRLTFSAPRLALVSNVTGRAVGSSEIPDARYWRRHLREPVRFTDGMQAMIDLGCEVFVELGPEPSLLTMGKGCAPRLPLTWLPTLKRHEPDWQVLLHTIGQLEVSGVAVDWQGFDAGYRRRRVELPASPYERKRFWFEAAEVAEVAGLPEPPRHPLLGRRISPLPPGPGGNGREREGAGRPARTEEAH